MLPYPGKDHEALQWPEMLRDRDADPWTKGILDLVRNDDVVPTELHYPAANLARVKRRMRADLDIPPVSHQIPHLRRTPTDCRTSQLHRHNKTVAARAWPGSLVELLYLQGESVHTPLVQLSPRSYIRHISLTF
ncbi:hypothetical protein MPTK1_2g10990 [Marchantia polymorpha subsp. ruderalis]|uniref:Uncharacterized protein n=1 Tax=Marchantia polymorpha TaxID=3197 RepID=A0A2R6XC98_MARPO|nr:hypothetical protein MARPO_0023s0065 [Marchantia polymorpha]BBN01874.1 hypothetical protein Mp_2g10990 [Marchantia polymorpha subsp. ruderalis]|eukprot:PTQ43736.1 hypothetical protein MARPO_0023s0065 [Marchantia polymorpha]